MDNRIVFNPVPCHEVGAVKEIGGSVMDTAKAVGTPRDISEEEIATCCCA